MTKYTESSAAHKHLNFISVFPCHATLCVCPPTLQKEMLYFLFSLFDSYTAIKHEFITYGALLCITIHC